jgi:hypothetical protein
MGTLARERFINWISICIAFASVALATYLQQSLLFDLMFELSRLRRKWLPIA